MKDIRKWDLAQPARLNAAAKTHRFIDTKQIDTNYLKFCPIIYQTGTHLYENLKIIVPYVQPLIINNYTIFDALSFPDIHRENLLDSNEQYVSYVSGIHHDSFRWNNRFYCWWHLHLKKAWSFLQEIIFQNIK